MELYQLLYYVFKKLILKFYKFLFQLQQLNDLHALFTVILLCITELPKFRYIEYHIDSCLALLQP